MSRFWNWIKSWFVKPVAWNGRYVDFRVDGPGHILCLDYQLHKHLWDHGFAFGQGPCAAPKLEIGDALVIGDVQGTDNILLLVEKVAYPLDDTFFVTVRHLGLCSTAGISLDQTGHDL